MSSGITNKRKFLFKINSPWPHRDSVALEVAEWCSENCEPQTYYPVPGTETLLIVLSKERDAIAFKLRFGL